MKLFSRGILITLGILLLILVVLAISLALVLGVALGIGWLLTLFLPFTLFESSLLAAIAMIMVGAFWYNLLGSVPQFGSESYEDWEDLEDFDEFNEIPASRFFKTEKDRTWEAWFRYQIANSIYAEFQASPQPVAPMGDKQLQELAIRLADVALPLLKAKTSRSKQLTVTVNGLKRQMTKAGQRPYDDKILQLAVAAIDEELEYQSEELRWVIENKLWDSPYELF